MTSSAAPGRIPLGLALGGLALVLAGAIGYFIVVVQLPGWLPSVRNHPVPNWILIAVGLGLGVLAVYRAPRGRWLPKVLLGASGMVAGMFAALLYGAFVVPAAAGPALGAAAPDFALRDQHGRERHLADFRGAPLLLVFYRGHW